MRQAMRHGSNLDPPNRFESIHRDVDLEHLDSWTKSICVGFPIARLNTSTMHLKASSPRIRHRTFPSATASTLIVDVLIPVLIAMLVRATTTWGLTLGSTSKQKLSSSVTQLDCSENSCRTRGGTPHRLLFRESPTATSLLKENFGSHGNVWR